MPEAHFGRLTLTLRISLEFVLQELAFRLDGSTFYDHVLLLSLFQGHGGANGDARRARQSIRSVADGVGLPYETSRRHLARMAARGLIDMTAEGCRIPESYSVHADYTDSLLASAAATRALVDRLGALAERGDSDIGGHAVELETADPPEIGRLAFDHTLRTIESLDRFHGRLLATMIFADIACWNLQTVSDGQIAGLADAGEARRELAELLVPATLAGLCDRIGISEAQAARQARRGVDLGLYTRGDRGLTLDFQALASPSSLELMTRVRTSLVRLLNELRSLARANGAAIARNA